MVQPATLGIITILGEAGFVSGKGEREGAGGDGAGLALEGTGRARGRMLVLAMDTYTSMPSPRK